MCSMSLTVVVSARSNGVVMRPAIWSGGRPVYDQTTPITGMRMSGKMSVGVRNAAQRSEQHQQQREHDESIRSAERDAHQCDHGIPRNPDSANPRQLPVGAVYLNRWQ